MSEARQAAIHHGAVRQQLEKILDHGLFIRSERMGRFLRLAVERSLEGKAGRVAGWFPRLGFFPQSRLVELGALSGGRRPVGAFFSSAASVARPSFQDSV